MKYFTNKRNVQIVLSLLKAHGIKRVVASPGTINMSLVVSMQHDSWFEMYSAADERSAAYMACGMAEETGEPVVLSCTGATASRNYLSGLTEAYYRKLPVLAITSTERMSTVGHLVPQVIDRSVVPNDIANESVLARAIFDAKDEWDCEIQVNRAILALSHAGGGPVHINLERVDGDDFSVREIVPARVIKRYSFADDLPNIEDKTIGIFVGSHRQWPDELTQLVSCIVQKLNALVFCDHTSNYHGDNRVLASLLASQDRYTSPIFRTDILIHIGEVSGDSRIQGKLGSLTKEVWRVSPDGKIKDTFRKLTKVFEMSELHFFQILFEKTDSIHRDNHLFTIAQQECKDVADKIPELPFSNIWIAQQTAYLLPEYSELHLGILNSLRSWNFFDLHRSIDVFCNVGGFGIDGCMSSFVGTSLMHPEKLYFGVFGDLAFFYDMNVLGNRHIGNNLRILLINNAKGCEFKLYQHPASRLKGEEDEYIAAARHYGNQSPDLVRHYAQDLGFKYLKASNKTEYISVLSEFIKPEIGGASILLEVFVDTVDESQALKTINLLEMSHIDKNKDKARRIVGEKAYVVLSQIKEKILK